MTVHELKIWKEYFAEILSRKKKHECRENDRGYRVEDLLNLREWDQHSEAYTGRQITCRVTYVNYGPGWGIENRWCVMSIEVL